MTKPRSPIAGGAPLALLLIVGTLLGAIFRQPAIGFFIGLSIGIAFCVVLWLRDRRHDHL